MCWAKSTKLKSFRTFHLENFAWMDSPNILLSWSRLLTLYSSMRRAVNITHPHSIHLTENNITLSSQTAKNIQNMKRLLLFRSIQLLQQSMNWINVQPDHSPFPEPAIPGNCRKGFLMDSWILLVDNIAKDNELLDFVIKKNLIRRFVDQMMLIIFSECP